MSPTAGSEGDFVGRQRELAALEAGLEAAFSGRGSVFLLVGEGGIGKTRLAEELCARAQRRGARAVWGSAWEEGGAPAYWPWVQVMRALGTELRSTPEASDEDPPPSESDAERERFLHELASPECGDVCLGQFEPLAVPSASLESTQVLG